MKKKSLSERDICTKYITPAIQSAGWDIHTQVREEVTFTAGRIIVRGKLYSRGEKKRADYILYHKPNLPIAVIEAKDNNHTIGHGMQQALEYAEALDVPFASSSNGDGFVFHDRTGLSNPVEQHLSLDEFPSPGALWQRYKQWRGIEPPVEDIINQPYYSDGSGREPRYYQRVAINRTVEAIAKGQNRILLVMATGTGKTYTAFQIIWRLWKSRIKKRILFLADRNILVDQTKTNDFKPFGQAMTKIEKRQADKSYEIYLSLYQAVTGREEEKNIYKQFSPDFFDLVVIDECHRGSAAEDSAWREILDYFSSATHVGLTATPKETKDVSNIHYFGEPIYTYSLKQGIEDGFLAPYKVVRIDLDKDLTGWRPEKGKVDKQGLLIEDRIYNQKDFDRTLVAEKRTELVARKVTEFLKASDRYAKTIVFCEDTDHAERMRQVLVNENADLAAENSKYVMRITGDDQVGKMELDNFIDPESRYPVIATTSRLMNTGVDAQTCKLIVLDQTIQSMTTFKQIIGRGTRINEDYGKFYFTIMDFKKATELFADPAFDGDPVQIYEPDENDPPVPPDPPEDGEDGEGGPDGELSPPEPPGDGKGEPRVKYIVDDVPFWVVAERVQYYGKDGKLITESLKDYTKRTVRQKFKSLDDFLRRWNEADKKQAIIRELEEQGVLLEALAEEVGKEFGPFDLICHVAFDQPPLTRRERAENVRKRNYFTKYGEQARAVLNALLDKYADEGVENIEDLKVLRINPFDSIGTPTEIVNQFFGGRQNYEQALRELEEQLYGVEM
ncbi:type I restriction enzyme R subunit [Geothermobacter ehrlichii]|uniref:Type I restriction enzyme R subunit n=1 Tax=Geothermobacter ehrlichii TaxID=213224 RepID=A0A5D3WN84_9BACT|nr:DEAD/DEAH box helicase family protein [Geothermobacter ehrlichii]TYO99974.1 type I restriction enzyme R subunit [Geothermobacter ehrlichii]